MNKVNIKQILTMFFWVLLSAIIQAIALTSFSVGAQIYPSGVAGLSRITSDILLDYANINLPYFYLYFLINLILSILVFKHIGKLFTIFSLLQTLLVSTFSSFFKQIIILDTPILMAIFGGLISGIGIGLALTHNASSGGTDFISIYYSNKYHKSMWSYVFVFNCFLNVVTGLIYGWTRAAYSIIYQYLSTFMISKMHKRYTHVTITAMSRVPDKVVEEVLKNTRHGITVINGEGAYTKDKIAILYTVINAFQQDEVIDSILRADPKAFINIQDTKEIKGNYYQKPLD